MPPPQKKIQIGGASNVFGPPPQFLGKILLMFTINVQCFSLKNSGIHAHA